MSSVDKEYYEYLMSQDKSDLAIEIMNLETSSSNDRIAESIKENDQLKQQRQDKISFAVEQLELAQKYIKQYVNNFDDMNDCLYAIDNQIKELKGEE